MKSKIMLVSVLIFLSRMLDLYTTQLSVKDFQRQEQNLIVKMAGMNMETFFAMETILAFLFVMCYWLYFTNKNVFLIKADSIKQYINLFFFNKSISKIRDWLTYFNFRKTLILLGACIPEYVITTSIIFSLNNYWAYLYDENNDTAIKYYLLFNNYYFFDFLIFVFPLVFLFFLLFKKINKEFERNKYHKSYQKL